MRRRYITHPKFQLGFTLAFIRGVLVALIIPFLGIILTLFLITRDPTVNDQQRELIFDALHRVSYLFAFLSALWCVVFGIFGGYLSYKFAGPIQRIEEWLMKHLSETPSKTLILRPGDEMSSLAKTLNRLFHQ